MYEVDTEDDTGNDEEPPLPPKAKKAKQGKKAGGGVVLSKAKAEVARLKGLIKQATDKGE